LATGLKVEFKEHLKSFDLIHKCKLKCVVFMLVCIYFVFMCALELGFKYNSFQFDRVSFELEIMRKIVKLLNLVWPPAWGWPNCTRSQPTPFLSCRCPPRHTVSIGCSDRAVRARPRSLTRCARYVQVRRRSSNQNEQK
jgi:hypothetical protein